jgi:hypothetical protein
MRRRSAPASSTSPTGRRTAETIRGLGHLIPVLYLPNLLEGVFSEVRNLTARRTGARATMPLQATPKLGEPSAVLETRV